MAVLNSSYLQHISIFYFYWTPALAEVSYEFYTVRSSVRPDIKAGSSVFYDFLLEVIVIE